MIKYLLRCINEHEFEAWFKSSDAYEKQAKQGVIECLLCGETQVSKALMAPAVFSGRQKQKLQENQDKVESSKKGDFVEAVAAIRSHVEENCDYVGDQFASEARKISYGESEERGIYGEATAQETTELKNEGIKFFRLPVLPRRSN